jgi:hypothetical protein
VFGMTSRALTAAHRDLLSIEKYSFFTRGFTFNVETATATTFHKAEVQSHGFFSKNTDWCCRIASRGKIGPLIRSTSRTRLAIITPPVMKPINSTPDITNIVALGCKRSD